MARNSAISASIVVSFGSVPPAAAAGTSARPPGPSEGMAAAAASLLAARRCATMARASSPLRLMLSGCVMAAPCVSRQTMILRPAGRHKLTPLPGRGRGDRVGRSGARRVQRLHLLDRDILPPDRHPPHGHDHGDPFAPPL